ncbi:ATP-binding protein [Streptomyces virginiae]|uniref:ATP-binding protein n=1 Tax=Streptomyces virginiae TaxID=1961 RepID=UPI0036FB1C5F
MSGLRAARHAPSRHAVTGPARQIRPQLVRAALLPTLAAALSGAAAVIFTLQLGGGAGDRDARLWPVLTGCALLVLGALAAALLGAQRAAKAVRDRCEALRRSSVRGRQELRTAAERLERGEAPPRPVRGGPNAPLTGGDPAGVDEFWLLSQELRGAREQAHTALVRLAGPAAPSDSERKVEVFVSLARRLQSLVHREISLLDGLEDTVEDPDLLKELFHVDHLATRIRRHAENLAVLGGAASRRQWTRPIDLSEVLRSSVAEVEQYTRVKVVPPAGGSVRGHAVADVVHLLAELVENATVFSPPDTDVVLRAERVTAGIAVEVEDRGLGMPPEEQHRMNALLGDPDQVSVRSLLADGRIGLYVVSALARRHGIAVELKSNIYGGVLAVLVLPQELLGAEAAQGSRLTPPLEPARMPMPRRAGAPTTIPAPRPEPHAGPAGADAWSVPGGSPQPDSRPARPTDPRTAPAPNPDPGPRAEPRAGHPTAGWPVPAPGPSGTPEVGPAASGPPAGPGTGQDARPGAAAEPRTRERPETHRQAGVGPAFEAGPQVTTAPAAGQPAGQGPAAEAAPWAGPGVLPRTAPAAEPLATPATGRPGEREPDPAAASWDVVGDGSPGGPGAGPAPELEAGQQAAPAPAGGRTAGRRTESEAVWGALGGDPSGQSGTGGVAGPAAWAEPAPGRPGESAAGQALDPAADAWGRDTRRGEGAADECVGGERPVLPRRRAQQHLAPQLREAPAPRPPADTEQPVHDPGLMAAFRRGFGLAQSENQV